MAFRVEKERRKEHQKIIKKIVNRRNQAEFLAYEIDKAYWELSQEDKSTDGMELFLDFEEIIYYAKNNKLIRLNDSVKLQRMNEMAQTIYLFKPYIYRCSKYGEICAYFGFLPLIATESDIIGL